MNKILRAIEKEYQMEDGELDRFSIEIDDNNIEPIDHTNIQDSKPRQFANFLIERLWDMEGVAYYEMEDNIVEAILAYDKEIK